LLKTRVIPSLLLHKGGLYKTVQFKDPKYVGDPINAIKIFNDKEVDELVVIDIDATKRGSIDFALLNRINKEAFMPLGYGGGIKTLEDIKKILGLGYEKIVINSIVIENLDFISQAAAFCGSQSVVVCIDIKKDLFSGYSVYLYTDRKSWNTDPVQYAKKIEQAGAGEIILYSVDRDGTSTGYDIPIIKKVSQSVSIPVVALGGARNINDFALAVKEGHASAVSAGSMFVFIGPHKAVLITYPGKKELKVLLDA
jgi:cyclase